MFFFHTSPIRFTPCAPHQVVLRALQSDLGVVDLVDASLPLGAAAEGAELGGDLGTQDGRI